MNKLLYIILAIVIGLDIYVSPLGKVKYLRNLAHFISLLKG